MALTRTRRDPTFTPGERVTLKADKNARPWLVITTLPGGCVRIQREGSQPSIYTQMNARPDHLERNPR